jgi:anti-sigma factor RsiW
MKCDEARGFMHDLHDGELRAADATEVRRHADTCRACREELESIRKLDAALAGVKVLRAPANAVRLVMAEVAAVQSRRFIARERITQGALALAAGLFLVLSGLELTGLFSVKGVLGGRLGALQPALESSKIDVLRYADAAKDLMPQLPAWWVYAAASAAAVILVAVALVEESLASRLAKKFNIMNQ